jgi:hypothetical protein
MHKRLVISIFVLTAILVVFSVLFGEPAAQAGAAKSDLNGLWNRTGGLRTLTDPPPPMTPEGQKKFSANKPSYNLPSNPRAIPPALGNDPAGRCDPLGLVRSLFAFRPVEFVVLPNRVIQFFEWTHVWRTIWTDGRKLPEDPDVTWYGYSVGRWEGDTLIVDSLGFDDRTWLDQYGDPFTSEMKTEERWRRVGDNLELVLTVNDPKTYTKPWVSTKIIWRPVKEDLREEVCAPIDEEFFNEHTRNRAGGVTK